MEWLRRELAGIRHSVIAAILIALAVGIWAKLSALSGPVILVFALAAITLLLVLREQILRLWTPQDVGPPSPDQWGSIIREWLIEQDCVIQKVDDPVAFFNILASLDNGPTIAVAMTREHPEYIHFGVNLVLEQDLVGEVVKASAKDREIAFANITLELLKLGAELSNISQSGVRISIKYRHGGEPNKYLFLQRYFDMRRYVGIAMLSYQAEFTRMANRQQESSISQTLPTNTNDASVQNTGSIPSS